ncbi:uncharacterized protein LOC129589502 [Paramacrobiotus metropolitanus]|uniref:uncharacterized protein LOC129589502 n=1 Tax=Paramacrobiotus metropolitanus TaxID=2943436 RepID=UPI002445877F|nr:uncharacterized protein LOC129589502 [Paramacrobiotus metropolitanus]
MRNIINFALVLFAADAVISGQGETRQGADRVYINDVVRLLCFDKDDDETVDFICDSYCRREGEEGGRCFGYPLRCFCFFSGLDGGRGFDRRTPDIAGDEMFRDDFSANTIDRNWNVKTAVTALNRSIVYSSSDNVWISNGLLHINEPKRPESATHAKQYTVHVSTGPHFSFTYGEVEIRAKLPTSDPMAVISMLRLVDAQCAFDSVRTGCSERAISVADLNIFPNKMTIGITHQMGSGRLMRLTWPPSIPIHAADSEFHIFKVVWGPNSLDWYLDGSRIYRMTDRNFVPVVKMQLVFELDVHSSSQQRNAAGVLAIDYIAVRPLATPTATTTTTYAPDAFDEMIVNTLPTFATLEGATATTVTTWQNASTTTDELAVNATTKPDASLSRSSPGADSQWKMWAVAAVAGVFCVVCTITGVYFYCRQRARRHLATALIMSAEIPLNA